MGKFIDLTGTKIGMLTIMYRTDDYIQPSGQQKEFDIASVIAEMNVMLELQI